MIASLGAVAPNHFSDLTVTRSGGLLGQTLTYSLAGDASETFFLTISLSQGPIPVALFCPGDPRILEVGTELQSVATLGVLNGSGEATATYAVPILPSLQGTPLYAQGITFGLTCIVGDLSSQNAFSLAAPDTSTTTLGPQLAAADSGSATVLLDGRVLLAGGGQGALVGATTLDSLQLYDPQTSAFSLLPTTLTEPRFSHAAILLQDGRVLLAGGTDGSLLAKSTCEIFDPATGTVSTTAPMSVPRVGHTATLLQDGRVFVTGGTASFDFSDVVGSFGSVHSSTEVYDPATGTWSAGPNLPEPRGLHSASLLGNGQVLITGGIEVQSLFGIGLPVLTSDVRRFDPGTNSMLPTASLLGERALHAQVTLPDGDALVIGGFTGDLVLFTFNPLASVLRYDTTADTWTSLAPLNDARGFASAVLAGDEVVVVGGLGTFDFATQTGAPVPSIEAAPLSGLAWATTGSTLLPREVAASVAIEGGDRVLTVGIGDNGVPALDTTAELYHP